MLTKHRSQAGSVHIVLLLGAVLAVVAAIGYFTYARIQHDQKIAKERALYAAADKEARAYIDAIAAKYPGEVSHENECSYTSEIYSKGFLGCSTGTTIDILLEDNASAERILLTADDLQKSLSWEYKSTSLDNTYASPNDIRRTIYNKAGKTCSIAYGHKETYELGGYQLVLENGHKILEIQAHCSGPALAEYY